VFAYESGATLRTSIGVDASGTAAGLVSTHESTYNHGHYNTAYDHSQLVAGNPHSVTPTELSLLIGTDTQAWDAQLDDIAALAVTDGNFIVGDSSNWVAESGNTARTSLGLGTEDSPTLTGLTLTGLTPGSLLFAGAGGLISQDNANLFWDSANAYLGFGTATPTTNLHIHVAPPNTDPYAQIHVEGDSSAEVKSASVGLTSHYNSTSDSWFFGVGDGGKDNNNFRIVALTASHRDIVNLDAAAADGTLIVNASSQLGVGVTPNEKLEVEGKIRANIAFNLDGTDGVSDSAVGIVTASTVSGGILTAVTKNDWIDQSVKIGADPTFSSLTVSESITPKIAITHTSTSSYAWHAFYEGTTLQGDFLVLGSTYAAVARRNNLEIRSRNGDIVFPMNNIGIGVDAPAENIHAIDTIRADTAFNHNGTDGITDTDAGVITDIDVSGGIVTAITKSEITHQTLLNFSYNDMHGDEDAQLVAGDIASTTYTHKGRKVWSFDDTVEQALLTDPKVMPAGIDGFSGTLHATLFLYMGSDNTNDIAMDAFVEAVTPDADTLDLETATGWDSVNAGTISLAGTTAGDLVTMDITLTNADNVAVGDLVRFGIRRDCDSANDDASGDVNLIAFEVWK